jgi:hypothetical protein
MQLPIHSQPLANRVAGFMAEAAKISNLRATAGDDTTLYARNGAA